MKKALLPVLILLITICSTGFSSTLREISSDLVSRITLVTGMSQKDAKEQISKYQPVRSFLYDSGENKFFVLMKKDKSMEILNATNLATTTGTVEPLKAVQMYLSVQEALFSKTTITTPYNSNKLLMEDLSYVDYFSSTIEDIIDSNNKSFKKTAKPGTVNKFLQSFHDLKVWFYNNFENYFTGKDLNYKKSIYEESLQNLGNTAENFIIREIKNAYSQINILGLLEGYALYQEELTAQYKPDYQEIPFHNLIENDLSAALRLNLNIAFLEHLTAGLKDELNQLNQSLSKSYGTIELKALEKLLLRETLFEIVAYDTLRLIEAKGTQDAKTYILKMFLNYKTENGLKEITGTLQENIFNSVAALSEKQSAYEIFKALKATITQKITILEDTANNKMKLDSAPLIKPFRLKNPRGHFAIVKSSIGLDSKETRSFSKELPIFSSKITEGNAIVLVDFFWFAAENTTKTLLKTFKALILNGFNIGKLEEELKVENVEISVEEFIEMEAYHELYRMKPTGTRKLDIKVQNSNVGLLALDNLFSGNVPESLLKQMDKMGTSENFSLARYPIEYYSTTEQIKSSVAKKDKAILFVHGKQNIPYINDRDKIVEQVPFVWRDIGRMDVWNLFYQTVNKNPGRFGDYDFYEFVYDTSVEGAKGYGETLAGIAAQNHIFDRYNEITMIASSMGGLVSRHALNTEVNNQYLGDKIKRLITLDTPHLGTIAQNFILTINAHLFDNLSKIKDNPPQLDLTVWKFIMSFVNGTESEKSGELLIYFAQKHPELVGKLFTEMLRFLDPFPGGLCMNYAPDEFTRALGIYLYSQTGSDHLEDIFVKDPPTNELNKNDRYTDKLYLVSSELTKDSTDITQGLSVTYNLMKKIGEVLSNQTMENQSRHGRNDGVVNLYSQQMWGIDKGQTRHHFTNHDHLAVPRSGEVVNFVIEEIILKKQQ